MSPQPPKEPRKPGEEIAKKAQSTYDWWNNLVVLDADDPVWLMLAKLSVRVLGIIILLAMSPLILLGVLMAFVAVA